VSLQSEKSAAGKEKKGNAEEECEREKKVRGGPQKATTNRTEKKGRGGSWTEDDLSTNGREGK